jgi:predicted enzyme related to lactoylglutathione lyase
VCWVDLGVGDADIAAAFYSRLLNWSVAAPDETGYRLASLGGHLVAALGPAEDPGIPYWTVYVCTADIAASVKAVAAAGGSLVVPPTDAGDAGVSAVVRDPCGGPLSLWQPGTHRGTYLSSEHGTLAGVGLRIDALAEQRAFLRAALGWRVRADGTITQRGRVVATWTPGPSSGPERPSPWLVSFTVADRAVAVERALELGASRCADGPDVLIDPGGATFAVRSSVY